MKLASQDFVRRLPDSNQDFARAAGMWKRLHIDPILLLLLLLLTCYGVVVLYSASGQQEILVRRQLIFFIIAYVAMFITAQLDIEMVRRWAPGFTLVALCCWFWCSFGG